MPKLLIAASGTGGHIFPALAVAQAMPSSWEISWIGVPDRLESNLVPKKYGLITVRGGSFQGLSVKSILQLFSLFKAILKVRNILLTKRVQVVFTTGGYISAPAILGAILCGIPVVLHESNAFPGLVTRLLGRFCSLVALGFPKAAEFLPGCRTTVTGTPVRSSFLLPQPLPNWVPIRKGPLIVVIGGSQGAIGLNQMVRPLFAKLLDEGCRIVHLTGANDPHKLEMTHPNFVKKVFSEEMPGLLQNADLVISRAGAGSLSEFSVCGTPAILVPFPFAKDNHQDVNASCAAEVGAALIVHQHGPEGIALSNAVYKLLSEQSNSNLLHEMKLAMHRLASKNADNILVDLIEKII